MEAHQAKKSARLRLLRVAERFFEPDEAGLSTDVRIEGAPETTRAPSGGRTR